MTPAHADLETVLDAEALQRKALAQPICDQCAVKAGARPKPDNAILHARHDQCSVCREFRECCAIRDWDWKAWEKQVDVRFLEVK